MGIKSAAAPTCPRFALLSLAVALTAVPALASTYDDYTYGAGDGAYTNAAASFPSVGAIIAQEAGGGRFLCSATIIQPSWAVTAAHCVTGDITSMSFGTALTTSSGWAVTGTTRNVIQWMPHPNYTGNLSQGKDIGLIKFSDPITSITPSPLFAGSDERGRVATSAGFGLSGKGSLQDNPLTGDIIENRVLDGQKRAMSNMVDVHFLTAGRTNDFYGVDFDNPRNPGDSSWGSTSPIALEGNTLFGDSGGGSFLLVNGQYQLAGVNSFISASDGNADGDYGDRGGYTRVALFANWINGTIGGSSGGGGNGGGKGGGKKNAPTDLVVDMATISAEPLRLSSLAVTIPEPSGMALAILGALGLLGRRRFAY